MEKEPGDPDCAKLEAIEKSAQRASDLTKQLLIFSRKVESKVSPVDLNQEVVHVSISRAKPPAMPERIEKAML